MKCVGNFHTKRLKWLRIVFDKYLLIKFSYRLLRLYFKGSRVGNTDSIVSNLADIDVILIINKS